MNNDIELTRELTNNKNEQEKKSRIVNLLCDYWSKGVPKYTLLQGHCSFHGTNKKMDRKKNK